MDNIAELYILILIENVVSLKPVLDSLTKSIIPKIIAIKPNKNILYPCFYFFKSICPLF